MLERTVELAKATKAFDPRKLPKTLRVAIDSSPLEGAGRVEDTFNLLAHAARKVVSCAAGLLGWTDEQVCREAGIPLLMASSIKRALDIDWNEAVEKAEAMKTFSRQLDSLQAWIERQSARRARKPPLQGAGRDPGADPDAGSGARSAGRWVAHSPRASPRIDASRSRIRRCVTAVRTRASGSMDSSGTLLRTSIAA